MLTSRQSLLPRPGGGKDLGQRVARTYHEDKSCVVQHKQKLDGGEWGLGEYMYIYIYGDYIGIALPYSLLQKEKKNSPESGLEDDVACSRILVVKTVATILVKGVGYRF